MPKILIGVLNHNRFELLERTINSTLNSLGSRSDVDWAIWDNGSSKQDLDRIRDQFGFVFSHTLFQQRNLGIGAGLKGLHEIAVGLGYDYYIHLENDWLCEQKDDRWLDACLDIMQSQSSIGIIKLRASHDGQYEMHPSNVANGNAAKYSPWWLSPIPVGVKCLYLNETGLGYYAAHVERGYSNNPHLLRVEMIKGWEIDDSVEGYGLEEEKIEMLPSKQGWMTANFDDKTNIYRHIG